MSPSNRLPDRLQVLCQRGTYPKVPNFSNARNMCCNQPEFLPKRPNHGVINGVANIEDPDQAAPRTASLGVVLSGFSLFALTYLSEN